MKSINKLIKINEIKPRRGDIIIAENVIDKQNNNKSTKQNPEGVILL
jgi:hypothetical protein